LFKSGSVDGDERVDQHQSGESSQKGDDDLIPAQKSRQFLALLLDTSARDQWAMGI
jgi:hypothetical protein